MHSSKRAERVDLAPPDLLTEPPRPALRVIASTAAAPAPGIRRRASLTFRKIVKRNQGLHSFRIY